MKKNSFCLLLIVTLLWLTSVPVCVKAESAGEDVAENREMEEEPGKIPVKVLILPKFEVGELTGDFPGEAQLYYENYLDGGEAYDIPGTAGESRLYVKDEVALFTLGMGKVRAGLNTMAVLKDPRFDFSEALILSTGCAGSAYEYGVMGDVFIITSAVDYDLGHHADSRDLSDQAAPTWFHDSTYDESAVVMLNRQMTDLAYELVKDVPLKTTERTRQFMEAAFDGAEWAMRDPKVQKGTTVTGDNYWKGMHDHENALLMTETYGCPDPYALAEMEDVAVATAIKNMGLLDHFLIIRDSVNMDVFMQGANPESLWDPNYEEESLASEDSVEAADIFETAMRNNYVVGKVVIDAALSGELLSEPFDDWNTDAPALNTLIDYVETVTDPASSEYIPPEDRIAVFDLDGTLFPELNPSCLEDYLLAHRILTDPFYEPDEEMLEYGCMLRDHMLDGDFPDYVFDQFDECYNRAFAGITLEEYDDFVTRMVSREADGFEGITYAEAFFDPMVEVVDYLQKNDFEVFLCSANDRFVCRTLVREGELGIPYENIIGTDVKLQIAQETNPGSTEISEENNDYEEGDSLIRTDQAMVYNYKENKVTQIAQEIGRRPVLSFGNSSGDVSMHNYTIYGNPYKSLAFMLLADDDVREYGNADEELRKRWEESGYQVISMKKDWQTIYGEDVVKTGSFHWLEDLME